MPTQRFGRENVLDAALELVRERGYDALSARAVAELAGCSVQPIYSLFGDMEGLARALYDHARAWVGTYNVEHADDASNPFEANGWAHIRIAREEPQLFAFLYLSPYLQADGLEELYASVTQPGVEQCIMELGGLGEQPARELYLNMIVYTHGLASMLACGAGLSDEEIAGRIDAAFRAFARAAGANPKGAAR